MPRSGCSSRSSGTRRSPRSDLVPKAYSSIDTILMTHKLQARLKRAYGRLTVLLPRPRALSCLDISLTQQMPSPSPRQQLYLQERQQLYQKRPSQPSNICTKSLPMQCTDTPSTEKHSLSLLLPSSLSPPPQYQHEHLQLSPKQLQNQQLHQQQLQHHMPRQECLQQDRVGPDASLISITTPVSCAVAYHHATDSTNQHLPLTHKRSHHDYCDNNSQDSNSPFCQSALSFYFKPLSSCPTSDQTTSRASHTRFPLSCYSALEMEAALALVSLVYVRHFAKPPIARTAVSTNSLGSNLGTYGVHHSRHCTPSLQASSPQSSTSTIWSSPPIYTLPQLSTIECTQPAKSTHASEHFFSINSSA
ncbi:hypothetical protein BASA50_007973 [Batrachochytrium salamandrivorans]|uniref:Uncharacterized protein n=1 Tax=Batrachochytrium salamandrivorans TaxID=1357716 RepID=A0ABQ8F5X6_9FUNG|nr:hypothetical protein BASA62_007113 [Batrachochytrium salamandrivorans]KAH6572017.1 hypothetical protein BASA60_006787 [Batrachochytrium salamandrivorans]KAH6592597.1 hypothetical protein BASA50_007973 [Batrachochytrium salamandrivorans]KAH9273352.1 hypothetical protein BASA83_004353 [Batrachochytrium salamandrivorans]KAJ1332368.1 hypothetical protein BSLG_008672 [Batrachochytrium salamandrivorans]